MGVPGQEFEDESGEMRPRLARLQRQRQAGACRRRQLPDDLLAAASTPRLASCRARPDNLHVASNTGRGWPMGIVRLRQVPFQPAPTKLTLPVARMSPLSAVSTRSQRMRKSAITRSPAASRRRAVKLRAVAGFLRLHHPKPTRWLRHERRGNGDFRVRARTSRGDGGRSSGNPFSASRPHLPIPARARWATRVSLCQFAGAGWRWRARRHPISLEAGECPEGSVRG